jgi:uncharacterized alkaline shock family protein YloU
MTELVNGVPGPFPAPRTDLSTSEPGQRSDPGRRSAENYEPAPPPFPARAQASPPALSAVPGGAAAGGTPQLPGRRAHRPELDDAADRGQTIIANEVVEKIVVIAAREVPGVHDLGGDVSRVYAAMKERVGLGAGDGNQGVSVRLDGAKASIKVTLVIEYGFVVYSVTDSVRSEIVGAVEKMLGLDVTAVDIVVDDIHVPDA